MSWKKRKTGSSNQIGRAFKTKYQLLDNTHPLLYDYVYKVTYTPHTPSIYAKKGIEEIFKTREKADEWVKICQKKGATNIKLEEIYPQRKLVT